MGELLEDGEIETFDSLPKAVIGGWWGDIATSRGNTGTNIEDYINVTNYEQHNQEGRKIYTENNGICYLGRIPLY